MGEGNLVIDNSLEDLQGIKTIYIIREVIYAERISVEINVRTAVTIR